MPEHYARKPLPIDSQKSVLWAIASLRSVGAGPAALAVFDLTNRETHRAHRLAVKFLSWSKGILPVTASFTSSDYVNFRTHRPVNFDDFDGVNMTMTEVSIGLYTWDTLLLLGIQIEVNSSGISLPNGGVATGITDVLYSDGQPLGSPDLEITMPPATPDPPPIREVRQEEVRVRRVPVDVLFDFDKYLLKRGERTANALNLIGGDLQHWNPLPGADYRFLIIDHTDSIGGAEYNLRLSRRRAETVAKWLIEHNYLRVANVKTIGKGSLEPVASNSTLEGRAENRRVEAVVLQKKLWDAY
jgi:outer membrane protein OmpA-like peptidoglycan-associated protein